MMTLKPIFRQSSFYYVQWQDILKRQWAAKKVGPWLTLPCVHCELQGPRHQLVFQRHGQEYPLPIFVCLESGQLPLCLVFSKLAQKQTNTQQL
jgi:hypothetical protein